MHQNRASGKVVDSLAVTDVKVADDSVVLIRAARNPANSVDLRRAPRAIIEVHSRETDVRPVDYGVIYPFEQKHDWIVRRGLSLRHHQAERWGPAQQRREGTRRERGFRAQPTRLFASRYLPSSALKPNWMSRREYTPV